MPVKISRRVATVAAAVMGAAALATTAVVSSASPAPAATHQTKSAPLPGFQDGYATSGVVRVHYVIGGHGPALVLLHGWPETWYAWADLMPALARTHTVVAIDLRGLGGSSPAPTDAGQYTALALAGDVRAVVTRLGLDRTGPIDLAGHDWGGNIALAYALAYRSDVRQLAVLEAPAAEDYTTLVRQQPGTFWWDWFINGSNPGVAERLVDGQPGTFYLPFWANSNGAISAAVQQRYLDAYRRPASTHAGFELFRQQDAGEQQVGALVTKDGKLAIPTLGVGGQNSMNALVGKDLGDVATHVTTAVVPDANHWVMEEDPGLVLQLLSTFFTD
ncbi:alpha/beta fold hydrolase [Fodinicola feengrottensis]|uniref:Alpha/beta hydrolase n=1 Tax=Fodinicola feengrottensis TaxID=435914 RepID=A0ABP4V6Q8_9ACTN|nr:alpha/beta hydrolase [Fodinicola feengrottensis]